MDKLTLQGLITQMHINVHSKKAIDADFYMEYVQEQRKINTNLPMHQDNFFLYSINKEHCVRLEYFNYDNYRFTGNVKVITAMVIHNPDTVFGDTFTMLDIEEQAYAVIYAYYQAMQAQTAMDEGDEEYE